MVLDVRDTARYLESIAPDSPEAREIISEVYEKRFVKISCTLGERTVDVWVYMGPRSDYLIVPRSFCSCKDFMIRVASTRKTLACKHLVGVELALRLGKKRDLALDADTCVKIAFEVLEKNLSPTLRKALYTAQQ